MAIFTQRGLRLGPKVVPTEPVEVDDDNPLTSGLIGLWLPRGRILRDYSHFQNHGFASGNPSITGTSIGPTASFTGSQYYTVPNSPALELTGDVSVTALMYWASPSYYYTEPLLKGNNTNKSDWGLQIDSSGRNKFNVNGAYIANSPTDSIPLNEWFVTTNIVNSSGIFGYTNSDLVGNAGPASVGVSTQPFYIGYHWGGDALWKGHIAIVPVHNRALSQAEISEIYAEPFAMLCPLVRRQYYVAASAVAAIAIDPATGTAAASGQQPSITQGIILAPTSGAATGAGETPSVAQGIALDPTGGAGAAAGQTSSVTTGITVRPSAGAGTAAGKAPAVTEGVAESPAPGATTATGQQPAVTTGATETPASGAAAATGQTPSVAVGIAEQPGPGAETGTGQQPTVTSGSQTVPGTGQSTAAGGAPAVTLGISETVGGGTGAAAGQAPTISSGQSLSPGAGTADAAGEVPSVTVGTGEQASAGAALGAGQQPQVTLDQIEQPGAGAETATGQAPTVLTVARTWSYAPQRLARVPAETRSASVIYETRAAAA